MIARFRRSFFILAQMAAFCELAVQAPAAEQYTLWSAQPANLPVRVTADLEVGGYLKVEIDKKPQQLPMSVVARIGYDEQRIDDGAAPDHRLAVRYYDETQAVIKVADKVTKPELRDDRKLIAVAAVKEGAILSSPRGPLTREELDLIDIPGNTLVLDDLLSHDSMELGHKWKPSDDALARILGLDAVGHTELECQLVDVHDGIAEITLEGTLGGAINGVASDMEIKGKLEMDQERHIPKSLILAIKEQRGIGHVAPGLDVVAKLKLTISPLTESKYLTTDVLQNAKLPQADLAASGSPLEYRSDAKGYRFLYDRRWHITREQPDLVVLRFLDRGDLIAQCNVAPSSKAIEKPVELTQFQTDVQSALGKMFGRFEKAGERGTDSGLRILETVATGKAEELPIEWRYCFVHDRQGRALSVVITLEAPLVEQFHDQEKPLVDSVEFLEPKMAAVPETETK